MNFTKMEGCGNDYIYINCFDKNIPAPSALAIAMSDRHFGIGSDGLILILPDEITDFRMRMFNSDGTESEMCGNGIRCFGKYVYDRGLTNKTEISINTLAGIRYLKLNLKDDIVDTITVDMGEPILNPELIPVKSEKNPVIDEKIQILDKEFLFSCVSMGNPHAVTVVDNVDNFPVEKYGSIVENDEHFPKRVNVGFVEIVDRQHLKLRVWERGAGETFACGTGSCAAVVAMALSEKCERSVNVEVLGGKLDINWKEDNHVYMTGPAEFVFDGVWLK